MNSLTGPNDRYAGLKQQYKDKLTRYGNKRREKYDSRQLKRDERTMQKQKRSNMLRGGNENEMIPQGYRKGTLQQFTPEQMELLQHLMGQLSPDSYLSRLGQGDEELFDEMEAPALRQFGAIQSNIASRYSNSGLGARKSSGFQNEMQQSASTFAQDLAARRQGLQQQAITDLQGLGGQLLGQRPYENLLTQKPQKEPKPYKPGIGDQITSGVGSFLGGVGRGLATGLF